MSCIDKREIRSEFTTTPHTLFTCKILMPSVLSKHLFNFALRRNNVDIYFDTFEVVYNTLNLFVNGVTIAPVTISHDLKIAENNYRSITFRHGRSAFCQ